MKPQSQQGSHRSIGPKLTFEDRILEYMSSEGKQIELSKDDAKIFVMVNFCDDQLRRLMPTSTVVKMLKNKFGIGETRAWQLVSQTQVIFGTHRKAQKDYFVAMIADNIVEDMQRARAKGDTKSLVGFYDKLIKVMRLDKDDTPTAPDTPPPVAIIYNFDPSMFNVKPEDNLEERAKHYINTGTEDTQFTDVTDGADDDGE